MVIQITPNISISEAEIEESFIRTGGPGGQKVNKTSTGVQIRFDAVGSPSLPEDVRARLKRIAGNRMTKDGQLIIEATRFRTQERNRQDALERLIDLIRQAARRPKSRRKTAPSPEVHRRRLQAKRHRARIKADRRRIQPGDEQ
ncbi:MAG: aminoacyl-tRNA hydrolase [Anaerolineales bacterium]|nr:aminoacyl-tRNA hydrolase [Anaerolineales bacterium]